MTVCVIIVNWNAGALLEKCLAQLARQTLLADEVIVADNGSSDGSCDCIELCEFPVKLLQLNENLGFARANNIAVQAAADCDWFAFLNPDAFPHADWLQNLLNAADRHKDYAVFASRMLQHDREGYLDGAGDDYHISGLFWRHGHGRTVQAQDLQNREVFSACAGAALYRRSAFEAVNGFDESFFCYGEDVDLGFRLRLKGYRCLYVADAVVDHIGSATSGYQSDFSIYHGHRNLEWVYFKNMPLLWLILTLPVHLLLVIVTIMHFLIKGKVRLILKAKLDAVKGLPAIIKARFSQPGYLMDRFGLVRLMKILPK